MYNMWLYLTLLYGMFESGVDPKSSYYKEKNI